VATSRRHLQGPLDVLLTLDVGKVHCVRWGFGGAGLQVVAIRLNGMQSLEVGSERGQIRYRDDFQSVDQGCFRRIFRRYKGGANAALVSQGGHGEDAGGVANAAIEGELTDEEGILDPLRPNLLSSQEDAHGNGQVVGRALFAQVSRSQVDGKALVGVEEPGVLDGRPHALSGLLDSGVRQANDDYAGQPPRGVYLYFDNGTV